MKTIYTLALSFTLLFLFSTEGIAQNCGIVMSTSTSITENIDGSRDFDVTLSLDNVSGGSKSVIALITCGGNVPTGAPNNECITVPPGGSTEDYSFTIAAGDNCTPELVWVGRTNSSCGGSTCNGANGTIVLPVELVKFEVKTLPTTNLLSWETASELNNTGFQIERSKDAERWEPISFIKGNGTTFKTQSYKWEDESPLSDLSYYRLKQIDLDGKSEYSKIVVAERESTNSSISVYPNPVTDEVRYNTQDDLVINEILILDAFGKQVFRTEKINGILSLKELPTGLYMLVLKSPTRSHVERIIKE